MAEIVEFIKCTNCKGTGYVPDNRHGRIYESCPICKGTGKKKIYKANQTKSK